MTEDSSGRLRATYCDEVEEEPKLYLTEAQFIMYRAQSLHMKVLYRYMYVYTQNCIYNEGTNSMTGVAQGWFTI